MMKREEDLAGRIDRIERILIAFHGVPAKYLIQSEIDGLNAALAELTEEVAKRDNVGIAAFPF